MLRLNREDKSEQTKVKKHCANYNTGLGIDVFAALTTGDNNVAVGNNVLYLKAINVIIIICALNLLQIANSNIIF